MASPQAVLGRAEAPPAADSPRPSTTSSGPTWPEPRPPTPDRAPAPATARAVAESFGLDFLIGFFELTVDYFDFAKLTIRRLPLKKLKMIQKFESAKSLSGLGFH